MTEPQMVHLHHCAEFKLFIVCESVEAVDVIRLHSCSIALQMKL